MMNATIEKRGRKGRAGDMDTARDMDTAIRKNADEIQRLQAQIRKCLAKGYRTQAKPLIKRLNEIKDRKTDEA